MEIDKETLLEGMDLEDINSVITKFVEINGVKRQMEKVAEELKVKIKIFMKEKRWNNYKPDDNISVTITRIEQTTVDKDKLKMILNKQQLESISKFKVIEKIMITTKDQRDRIKRFVNNGKNM